MDRAQGSEHLAAEDSQKIRRMGNSLTDSPLADFHFELWSANHASVYLRSALIESLALIKLDDETWPALANRFGRLN